MVFILRSVPFLFGINNKKYITKSKRRGGDKLTRCQEKIVTVAKLKIEK